MLVKVQCQAERGFKTLKGVKLPYVTCLSYIGVYSIRDLFPLFSFPPGKQLSKKAVKSTRAIASVRIHVERAIERLKDFRILQGNFLLPMLRIADNILNVCAALCNLLPPLAK